MTIVLNGTSGITNVDGTAAAPALTGSDTDTGIFFPAANTLAFATAGTEDARFDSAGNFGIGTSLPVAKQQIKGTGTSGQVTASWILENGSSGTAGMDITGSAGSSYLRFLYGGGPGTGTNTLTETMRIGLEGASAGVQQIKFAATQVASSDANTLDDYEEGTWTPVLGGDGGQSGQSYTARNGRYTKVGNICFVEFDIELSNKGTITGSANISGLPFTCANTGDISQGGGSITYFSNLGVSVVSIIPGPQPNQTYLYPRYLTAAAANITVGTAGSTLWLNNTRLVGMCWYQVN